MLVLQQLFRRDSTSENRAKIIDRKLVTKFSNNIRSDFGYLNRVEEPAKEKKDLFFKQNGKGVFKEVCPMVASLIMDQLVVLIFQFQIYLNSGFIKPMQICVE